MISTAQWFTAGIAAVLIVAAYFVGRRKGAKETDRICTELEGRITYYQNEMAAMIRDFSTQPKEAPRAPTAPRRRRRR